MNKELVGLMCFLLSAICFFGICFYCVYNVVIAIDLLDKILFVLVAGTTGFGGAVFAWVSYRGFRR